SPPIAHASRIVPADHFRQLPLDARMLASYLPISCCLRALLRRAVLGFVVVFDHGASTPGCWLEALRPQGTRAALGGAEEELPAVPTLGAHPCASRRPARTA